MDEKEFKNLGNGPYAVALNALSQIAFGPRPIGAMEMQKLAFDSFLACTEPCHVCGGIESRVDACGHCDHTGRLPKSPFTK